MLCREIIAVCSHIHTKHINTAVWAEYGPDCNTNSKLIGSLDTPAVGWHLGEGADDLH
jgi:hypothetical protein